MWIAGIPFHVRTDIFLLFFTYGRAARNIDGSTIDWKNRRLAKRMESCRKLTRALLKWNVRPHSRVFKDNKISRGFRTIRFLAFFFFCTSVLCGIFPMRLMKVDLFIIQLGNRMEFYEKAKTPLIEWKRDRAKQFHRLVRALHNRAQTRGQEWGIMRVARISQLRVPRKL